MSARLLPAALAAAAVTAIGAPAWAQEAPPPAEETHTEQECVEALKILSYFKLLPDQPDVGRTLCSMNKANQQEEGTHQDGLHQDAYTQELDSKYTTETGQTVEDSKLLGLPIEWPENLTVHVPTINDRWHSYSAPTN
ncbi:hypothetical protein E1281_24295 [Actinomadura sp. KC345]|uniref:hypothetical protein n=1 Tax=Actinomadura sp. KC345 TaxID=2530371 RepID=UPI0010482F9B|nr:hypothetical protein [Actinomadura sp. KC345]TDC48746.1 hypothetical protein E1281_24295 [Actinomadura sp. KC345]